MFILSRDERETRSLGEPVLTDQLRTTGTCSYYCETRSLGEPVITDQLRTTGTVDRTKWSAEDSN